ncbi:hypothetical protein ABNavy97_131 [Acinetobacter phage AB-Navy97]|uniref:Uncharacterized protein n=2 Tax=Lazarusvirus TaxID=2842820 RepID=A0A4Y1NMM3_9CAUD|nr:hypothetical protein HYP67_gp137 [Acinetobacter phage vB_ApiM_fHyAci03]YP_009889765.1 hypothetical protein HYP65_gp134 [Acinetobacter phage AM101]UJH94925.1 hypothetical protein PhaR5_190 [Acinetobacter phage PhaR5]UNI74571.1 hypothetical protein ABNavy4_133 [Acinetobacter phage AB-Navy4]UNI74815.1 hypothetical protein ABNavy97_131 [Acinetobacter phage AB-Navy97]UQS93963.1 hypothetical protein ABNavy1_133 [Acinetobacter phage AB-Navy1]UYL85907.1 hypothetical protein vBAbaPDP45_126 [Acineto
MKLKAALLSLLLVSPFAAAWEQLTPSIFTIYGTRIDQSRTPLLPPFAEISYDKETDSFGISFIGSNGIRTTIPYGMFNMRTCGINTLGAIAGPALVDISSKDQLDNIFLDCKRPIFFRVWNTSNDYVTYKFENGGALPETE